MLVLSCSGLSRGFDEGPLFEELGFELYAGERVGLVGPNGVGKTTLALADHKKLVGNLEVLHKRVRSRGHHITPGTLVRTAGNRRADDAEIRRIPVTPDDEVLAEVFHLVLMISLARQHDLEMESRVACIRGHHLHVLTSRLAKTHGEIVAEGLDAAAMLRQKGLPGARARRRG